MREHGRVNPLKAMSNRAGKREREARNRHKRGSVYALIGRDWVTLKLGSKKMTSYFWGDLRSVRNGVAAVPVDDRGTSGKSGVEIPGTTAGEGPAKDS